jgi:hypothetical protein
VAFAEIRWSDPLVERQLIIMRTLISLALLLITTIPATAAVTVTGTVRMSTGESLPGVTVWIQGSALTTTTDVKGAFALTADTLPATVMAYLAGFEGAQTAVTSGGEHAVELTLALSALSDTVTVTGRAPRTDSSSSFDFRSLDIVRTPGAQADVFRALQLLPGVAKIDEGAGLFVRGGDVSEVRVLLDGTTIAHPFRYETPTGGQFGTVTPMLLEGLTFSTGGFSARFGNALSAVLDLRGLGKPSAGQMLLTAGLAGASGRAALAGSDEVGLRASGNVTSTALLFDVNGRPRQFDRIPDGYDLDASAHYHSSSLGDLKVFAMSQGDHVGVELQKEDFDGFLHSSSIQSIVAASWKRVIGEWQLTSSLGADSFGQRTEAGTLDLATTDRRISWRFDAARAFGALLLRTGADADSLDTHIAGQVSIHGGDFAGAGGVKSFQADDRDGHGGAYIEVERKLGAVTPTIGVRMDRSRLIPGATVDPRVAVAIATTANQTLRLAWGIFHQSPSAAYFDRAPGAATPPDAMQAEHWILGYELGTADAPFFARIEAYNKRYAHLPLEAPQGGFTSDGYGWARGMDLYLQERWKRLELRASASVLDAARRWTPSDQRDQFPMPSGTWRPDFDIPKTINLSATLHATSAIDFGMTWGYGSGRPHTPIISAQATPYGYLPVYGPINSERLPPYVRGDANLSYRSHIGADYTVIYFAALSNAMARSNFTDYFYSTDFTKRTPIVSAHPRSFFFGVTLYK